jgi:hypothetical protein
LAVQQMVKVYRLAILTPPVQVVMSEKRPERVDRIDPNKQIATPRNCPESETEGDLWIRKDN